MRVAGDWFWFLNDHLGTPRKMVDASGAVVWRAAYLPFGKAIVATADVENNLRFPGQYYDAETGLHYNWHRYYDPSAGRYFAADPIGLVGGTNLYTYAQNNPLNYIDPDGLLNVTKMGVGYVKESVFNNLPISESPGVDGQRIPILKLGMLFRTHS